MIPYAKPAQTTTRRGATAPASRPSAPTRTTTTRAKLRAAVVALDSDPGWSLWSAPAVLALLGNDATGG